MRLMNDSHPESAKGNLCKGVFDSIVPWGVVIFMTTDHGVVPFFMQVLGSLLPHSMSRICLVEREGGGIS